LTFSFQSEVKPCEATLSPPIFTSCYALVTRLRYEDREVVADRCLLAVASATKRLEKLRATRSRKNRAICSATRSRTNAVRVYARSLLERAGFAKQASMIFITEPKF